jgi:hypothetical protein
VSAVEIKVGRKLAVLVPFNTQIVDLVSEPQYVGFMRDEAAKKFASLAEAEGYSTVVIDEVYSIKHPGSVDSFLPEDVDPEISVMKFTGLATK